MSSQDFLRGCLSEPGRFLPSHTAGAGLAGDQKRQFWLPWSRPWGLACLPSGFLILKGLMRQTAIPRNTSGLRSTTAKAPRVRGFRTRTNGEALCVKRE